ncbi:MAG: RNA-binding S4 domain-containing protein [Pirellulaceae bacterium]
MNDPSEPAAAKPLTIRLDQFLQLAQIAGTGGQAKQLIQQGNVSVNGEIETRRRRQLRVGDQVAVGDELLEVELES